MENNKKHVPDYEISTYSKEQCQQQITLTLRAKVTHQAIRSMLIAKTIVIIAKI